MSAPGARTLLRLSDDVSSSFGGFLRGQLLLMLSTSVLASVGLMALNMGRPLMVLGQAVYRRADLCHSGDLDRFWCHATPPATRQVAPFLRQLIGLTQVACDLYAPRSEPLNWRVDSALPATSEDRA